VADKKLISLSGYFDRSGAQKTPVEIALTIRRAIGQSLKITHHTIWSICRIGS
jgi:hypothetical protein